MQVLLYNAAKAYAAQPGQDEGYAPFEHGIEQRRKAECNALILQAYQIARQAPTFRAGVYTAL